MKYEVVSELGIKRFRKIEPMRDWLWQFFPKWLHKLRIYRVRKDGLRIEGRFINDKKVVVFK